MQAPTVSDPTTRLSLSIHAYYRSGAGAGQFDLFSILVLLLGGARLTLAELCESRFRANGAGTAGDRAVIRKRVVAALNRALRHRHLQAERVTERLTFYLLTPKGQVTVRGMFHARVVLARVNPNLPISEICDICADEEFPLAGHAPSKGQDADEADSEAPENDSDEVHAASEDRYESDAAALLLQQYFAKAIPAPPKRDPEPTRDHPDSAADGIDYRKTPRTPAQRGEAADTAQAKPAPRPSVQQDAGRRWMATPAHASPRARRRAQALQTGAGRAHAQAPAQVQAQHARTSDENARAHRARAAARDGAYAHDATPVGPTPAPALSSRRPQAPPPPPSKARGPSQASQPLHTRASTPTSPAPARRAGAAPAPAPTGPSRQGAPKTPPPPARSGKPRK